MTYSNNFQWAAAAAGATMRRGEVLKGDFSKKNFKDRNNMQVMLDCATQRRHSTPTTGANAKRSSRGIVAKETGAADGATEVKKMEK